MVGTIVPVGNGQKERVHGTSVVFFYLVGSTLGAAILGFALTSVGALVQHSGLSRLQGWGVQVIVGLVFVVAGAREAGLLRFSIPQSGWQVPSDWFERLGQSGTAFAFGAILALGFLTPVSCISFYASALWIVVMVGRSVGLLLAFAYVLGRVLPVIAIWYATSRSGRPKVAWLASLDAFRSPVLVLNGILLSGVGAVVLTAALYR